MSQKRAFHDTLSMLTRANAIHTLEFILEEARRIENGCYRRGALGIGSAACYQCGRREECRSFIHAFQPERRKIIE